MLRNNLLISSPELILLREEAEQVLLIIKMDTIKTEEHLKKAIPYVMNEAKTSGQHYSNSGVTAEQITDTFFMTKRRFPTRGNRQAYHYKFSFSKDENLSPEDALFY